MKEKIENPNEKQYSMLRVIRLIVTTVLLCFSLSKSGIYEEQIIAILVTIMGAIDIVIGIKCQQECVSWKEHIIAGICLIVVAILDLCNVW